MGADRARRSFDATRMYRSVVAQQGRVTLEADANEAEEIRGAESRAELLELIGPTGTPDDGFRITVPPPVAGAGPFDFGIGAGAIYVGGTRVAQPMPTTYERQKAAEWCDFPAGAPAPDPGAATVLPFDELVYLVVTEQEVGAVEDRVLREVALGGPDTSARTRLVQRVMRAPTGTGDCEESLAHALSATPGVGFDPSTMRVTTAGALRVDIDPAAAPPDPCEPAAQSGFLGAENQLIRLQVSGDGSLLWGYDNASFLYRGLVTPDQQSIKLLGTPVDVFHQPRAGQVVEVLDIAVDLGGGERVAALYGRPYALDGYDATANSIHLPTAVPQSLNAEVFVRVWENRLAFSAGAAAPTKLVLADGTETGVVIYTTGVAVPGDYWLAGVRPSTPTAILPARLQTALQPPDGPNRWATALAKIHWLDGTHVSVRDCRRPFDDLVTLTQGEGCELMLRPGDDLQRLIDRWIDASANSGAEGLHVHFTDGRFDLAEPIEFKAIKGGHLTITGCGRATELVAIGSESAVVTSGWQTTTVNDLSIAAEPTAGEPTRRQIGGALTILDTGVASVERVAARCASGPTRSASCLTIRNGGAGAGSTAEIRSCELETGVNQIGALLVNTAIATVADNRISQLGKALPVTVTRRTLIGNVRMGVSWTTAPISRRGRADASFTLWGDRVLAFTTEEALRDLWLATFEAHRKDLLPEPHDGDVTIDDRRRIHGFIDASVTQILRRSAEGPLTAAELTEFRRRLGDLRKAPAKVAAAAAQGIVVAGAIATDVRILHNTIAGAMQGIHVALSVRGARANHIRVERVQIVGNTISHRVPADRSPSEPGIFVGNVDLATIRDNRIRCEFDPAKDAPQATIRAEGIRVWGVLGDARGHFLLISGNISQAASTGIRVVQVGQSGPESLVQITQNLAMATLLPVQVHGIYEVAIDNRP
jgi:hypothetical protein